MMVQTSGSNQLHPDQILSFSPEADPHDLHHYWVKNLWVDKSSKVGLRENLFVFCSMDIELNWLIKTYCYTCRSMPLPTLILEAYFCSRRWLLRKQSWQVVDSKRLKNVHISLEHICFTPSSQGSEATAGEDTENLSIRSSRWLQGNRLLDKVGKAA